jgi:hypothetical protein
MATEVPWTEPDFGRLLDEKLGTEWADLLETKWGSEWEQPCARELAERLGDNWADSPQAATDTLVELLDEPADTADPGVGGTVDPPRSDDVPNVDLGQYEWLRTFNEADSFAGWLTRIGMSADDVSAVVDAGKQSGTNGPADPDGEPNIDFDQYEWLKTLNEADSFAGWLTRIGMSAEDVSSIVNAGKQSTEGGNR